MSKNKIKNRKKRLFFNVNSEVENRLKELGKGASVTEVVRRALALLDAVETEREDGAEFFAKYPDGRERPLHLPWVTT